MQKNKKARLAQSLIAGLITVFLLTLYYNHQDQQKQQAAAALWAAQQQAKAKQTAQDNLNQCINYAQTQAAMQENGAGAIIVYDIQRQEELAIQSCQAEYPVPN